MRRKETTPKTPFAKTFREIEQLRRQQDDAGLRNRISEIAGGNVEDVEHLLEAGDRALHLRCIGRKYGKRIHEMTRNIRAAKMTREMESERQAAIDKNVATVQRADAVIAFLNSQGITGEPRKKAM